MALSLTACVGPRPFIAAPAPKLPSDGTTLTLVGQANLPSLERYPPVTGLPFGGISGIVRGSSAGELFGISDAQTGSRIYRFALDGTGGNLAVRTAELIPLEGPSGEVQRDHEALTILANGNFLIASEGTSREPRRPPSIAEYGRSGDFIRLLPVRDRFVPEPNGPQTRGARGNAGFEALTLTPDYGRLFVGVETALMQDGTPATFEAGTRTRVLEYDVSTSGFEPRREFAYDLEPIDKVPFAPGFSINGLVELLALDRSTLLALERSYVEEGTGKGSGVNRIRVYRISLDGATDISELDSLEGRSEVVPVTKTLLLDLSSTAGLSPELEPSLDNFEGLAFGPPLPDGRATLVLVSDDNFSPSQSTWFLVFAIQ
jgi:hypothetical protein